MQSVTPLYIERNPGMNSFLQTKHQVFIHFSLLQHTRCFFPQYTSTYQMTFAQ